MADKLRNYVYQRPGMKVEVYGVTSQDGDGKTPNPHAWRRLYEQSAYSYQKSWTGYTGVMIEDHHDRNRTVNGVGYPDTVLQGWMTRKNSTVESRWPALTERNMEKIYDSLRGNNQLVVDFAERSSTIKMVKSALNLKRTMLEFAQEAVVGSKGRRLSGKRRLDYLSGKWLEYRYGWTPLVHSIYDAAENLRREVQEEDVTFKVRSTSRAELENLHRSGSGESMIYRYFKCYASFRQEIGITFKPPDPALAALANWTSLNPALIAWELVPLSFVADWFVNVGDQLQAWENYSLYSSSFKSGWMSNMFREDRIGTYNRNARTVPSPIYLPNGNLWTVSYGSCDRSVFTSRFSALTRTKLTGLPRPLGFQVKVNLNAKRVTDAAALGWGFWRKLLR